MYRNNAMCKENLLKLQKVTYQHNKWGKAHPGNNPEVVGLVTNHHLDFLRKLIEVCKINVINI